MGGKIVRVREGNMTMEAEVDVMQGKRCKVKEHKQKLKKVSEQIYP